MAKAMPKLEILIDLSNPVDEIKECILLIANSHPGKQKEIIQQIDIWIGEVLTGIEDGKTHD